MTLYPQSDMHSNFFSNEIVTSMVNQILSQITMSQRLMILNKMYVSHVIGNSIKTFGILPWIAYYGLIAQHDS